MNPLKVDKIQFGFSAQNPYVGRNLTNGLSLFDEATGVISLGGLLGERSTGAVLYVSQGSLGKDYSTIQDAHDALPETGGTIVVFEGEYTEALSITKPVHLVGRGNVSLQASDTILTISEVSVTLENINLKVLATLALVKCILATSVNDTTLKLHLRNCSLDTSLGAVATGISSEYYSVYISNTRFSEGASISCGLGNELQISSVYVPDVSLNAMVGTSYISSAQVVSVSLVSSDIVVYGKLGAVAGDAGSTLNIESIGGSIELDNTAIGEVEFDCPLATTEYFVHFETLSSREIPVVTARTESGFTFETLGNISEVVRWVVRA